MKKDITRDYITASFRLYAAEGQPTYEQAKDKIYNTALFQFRNMDPKAAVINAEKSIEDNSEMLCDIAAVSKTMELLIKGDRQYIVDAVKAVYFAQPHKPLKRGDISARVKRFAFDYSASEIGVYKWLKAARLLCASLRGLRTDDPKGL